MSNQTIIFCDGASKGNPGPGGWGVIIIDGGKVTELGGREEHTTNNRMELTGAIQALSHLPPSDEGGLREVDIYTDSKYLIGGMTEWIGNWQKNNWKTKARKSVLNQDLWKKLLEVTKDKKIKWHYLSGHSGIAGNERCDEIASALATGEKVNLYHGPLAKYTIKVMDLGQNEQ